jgi:hypothetical protein
MGRHRRGHDLRDRLRVTGELNPNRDPDLARCLVADRAADRQVRALLGRREHPQRRATFTGVGVDVGVGIRVGVGVGSGSSSLGGWGTEIVAVSVRVSVDEYARPLDVAVIDAEP